MVMIKDKSIYHTGHRVIVVLFCRGAPEKICAIKSLSCVRNHDNTYIIYSNYC